MLSPEARPRLGLLLLIAATLSLATIHMAGRPLWLDESWSRWMADQDWATLPDYARRFDSHPPAYYLLLKAWLCLVPATPAAMRLLSALAAAGLGALAWHIGGRIETLRERPWLRLAGAALVALSPALVVAARQARPYAVFALAFGVALAAALTLLRHRGRGRTGAWILYSFSLALTAWLHGLGVLFAAALGGGLFLALAADGTLRPKLLPFLLANGAAALAWLPCLFILLDQRKAWGFTWLRFYYRQIPDGLGIGLAGLGAFSILLFFVAGVGAAALWKRREEDRGAAILLLSGAVVPALLEILISAVASPVFLPRTLLPSLLPMALLAACGLAAIPSRSVRLGLSAALLLLVAGTAVGEASRPAEERWDRLSAWLTARVRPGEEVWLLPNELVLPLRYGGGAALPMHGVPAEFPAPDHVGPRYSGTMAVPGVTAADAARLVADARRRGVQGVWLVSRFSALFDPKDTLPQALAGSPKEGPSTRFAPIVITHYGLAGH